MATLAVCFMRPQDAVANSISQVFAASSPDEILKTVVSGVIV